MEFHINWCFQVLFHFFSNLEEEKNRFPESVVMLWDMGSSFYSKWSLMQWTLSSSLRATKYKVCQYAGRLWHLYSMWQESSELYSYFEIQKWMWTYVVTCHADCIRLLAGRGMNICHEVWSLSTVIPIQYTTNTRVCCSLETQGKSNIWYWWRENKPTKCTN